MTHSHPLPGVSSLLSPAQLPLAFGLGAFLPGGVAVISSPDCFGRPSEGEARVSERSGAEGEQVTADPHALRRLLDYDRETGILKWLPRRPEDFQPTARRGREHLCNNWNAQYAGRVAFSYRDPHGYLHGAVYRKLYKAHRVAWAIHYGRWPDGLIDHINGNRSDNSIANLRDVSATGNARNCRMKDNNTSGVTGVFWSLQREKWQAKITVNRKAIHLGFFSEIEAASAARKAALRDYGFAPRHGQERGRD